MNSDLGNLWQDLRRRHVFQVAAVYGAVAWAVVQVADVVVPAIGLRSWVMTAIVGLAMVGFPVAVILAWLFDITSEGVRRTRPGSATGLLAITLSLALLAAGTATFVWLINPESESDVVGTGFEPMANSIAVLPFADFSPDKNYEHFADGISEVLIHQLSQLRELHVIARTSSFAFKGQQDDMREIGRQLNVSRLLEGSVQRSGERLRIAAQLIDTRTGTHVWSKLFDRRESDIFAIQDEISIAVANAMAIELTDQARSRLSSSLTDDLDAMQLYLLGRNELMMADAQANADVPLDYFNRALAIDPNFALAWSGLADAYVMQGNRNERPMDEALASARQAAGRALELDEFCAEAHASSLLIALMEGDLDGGRASFERSSSLSPSYWPQYLWFGYLLYGHVMLEEASSVFAQGMALQPYKPYHLLKNAYANVLIATGRYAEGMRLRVELMNEHRGTQLEKQYTTDLSGRAAGDWNFVHAIAYAEIATLRGFDSVELRTTRAEAYLALGDREEAARQLTIAESMLTARDDGAAARARHRMRFVRGLYFIARGDAAAADRLIDSMIAEVDEIDPDAAYMISSRAFFPAVLSLFRERHADVARLATLLTASNPGPVEYLYATYAHRMLGDSDRANELLDDSRGVFQQWSSQVNQAGMDYTTLAEFQVIQDRLAEAGESLRTALEQQEYNLLYVSHTPILDVIRSEPAVIDTIERMTVETRDKLDRVRVARSTGNWQSLVAEHFATTVAANRP